MSEPITRWIVGPREGGIRLDHWMQRRIPGLSRTRIQRAIRERVSVSWAESVRPSTPVRSGGEVRIAYVPIDEEPLDLEIPILARGDGWLAVDKPAGIPVHPVSTTRENSLIRMLRRQTGTEDLRLVHRLDRETTGVLLLADNALTASALSRCFARRTTDKTYVAVVRGAVGAERGVISGAIGPASGSAVYVRLAVVDDGVPASTAWSTLSRGSERSVLELVPQTGRRHQLRVHLEWLGHPILGDPLYGHPDEVFLDMVERSCDRRESGDGPARMLLHCRRLTLPETPVTPAMAIDAPIPRDFAIWAEPATRDSP